MAWLYLIIAGISETLWIIALTYCCELKLNLALIIVIIAMISSMFFLSLAMQDIPLGISYAIWTGIGIVGISIYEIIFFKKTFSVIHFIFMMFIIIGILGLKSITK